MDTITASCPKCGTQYQLTPEQLSVAHGQVRCGACMTVFQAAPAPQQAAPKPSAPPQHESATPSRAKEQSAFVNDEDDQLLNDTGVRESFDDAEDFSTGEFSSDFSSLEAEDHSSFGDEHGVESADHNETVEADESWAEALLDDDETEDNRTTTASNPDIDALEDISGLDDDLVLQRDDDDLGFNPDDKEGLIGRINPEPLEFNVSRDYSLLRNIGYGLLSLILLASLGAQYLYFEFDELARQAKWRPTYEKLCAQLDCELPAQFKLQDIKARHLTVKSHPNYRNALMVDVIITNHADIDQPFPELRLFFTDNNQQVVAARKFLPSEYLRGELAHRTLMPSRQPVHLAVAIKDPGPRATGYSIDLSY